MHNKFNGITVKYNGTQHGIYAILELHISSNGIDLRFVRNITKIPEGPRFVKKRNKIANSKGCLLFGSIRGKD